MPTSSLGTNKSLKGRLDRVTLSRPRRNSLAASGWRSVIGRSVTAPRRAPSPSNTTSPSKVGTTVSSRPSPSRSATPGHHGRAEGGHREVVRQALDVERTQVGVGDPGPPRQGVPRRQVEQHRRVRQLDEGAVERPQPDRVTHQEQELRGGVAGAEPADAPGDHGARHRHHLVGRGGEHAVGALTPHLEPPAAGLVGGGEDQVEATVAVHVGEGAVVEARRTGNRATLEVHRLRGERQGAGQGDHGWASPPPPRGISSTGSSSSTASPVSQWSRPSTDQDASPPMRS